MLYTTDQQFVIFRFFKCYQNVTVSTAPTSLSFVLIMTIGLSHVSCFASLPQTCWPTALSWQDVSQLLSLGAWKGSVFEVNTTRLRACLGLQYLISIPHFHEDSPLCSKSNTLHIYEWLIIRSVKSFQASERFDGKPLFALTFQIAFHTAIQMWNHMAHLIWHINYKYIYITTNFLHQLHFMLPKDNNTAINGQRENLHSCDVIVSFTALFS